MSSDYADYAVPNDLPSFQPYLRSKYRDMPAGAVDDLNKAFDRIIKRSRLRPRRNQLTTGKEEDMQPTIINTNSPSVPAFLRALGAGGPA